MKNGDLPASSIHCSETLCQMTGTVKTEFAGLTKREQFAMAAMQGIVSCDNSEFSYMAAQRAVELADALLAELERTK